MTVAAALAFAVTANSAQLNAASLVNRGVEWAAAGDLERAIADYDAALRLRPDLVEALFNRGNAYRLRFQRARSLAQTAPKSGPSDESRALADYGHALTLSPTFAGAYVNRAILSYERGDYALAIADCDVAIRLQPRLAEAWNNRSLAWYRSGQYERAKADFDQTIKLEQFYGNAMIMRPVPDIKVGALPR